MRKHLGFGPVDGGGGWRRPPSPCEAARGSTGAPACAVYRVRVSARVVGVCARVRVSVRACVPRSPPRLSSVAAPRLRSFSEAEPVFFRTQVDRCAVTLPLSSSGCPVQLCVSL